MHKARLIVNESAAICFFFACCFNATKEYGFFDFLDMKGKGRSDCVRDLTKFRQPDRKLWKQILISDILVSVPD